MKLGSLFDGSGTAPLAAAMCGIEPTWASEIEPYPVRVTKARFPKMLHLGDITKIDGAEVEPVDIICGGSPCQDLSVAGKQAGLHEGERSHLFFEMTRIIKEMRLATDGKYPRYIIWENVPGAFSSNSGEDFYSILKEFAQIADSDVHVPRPACKGKTDKLDWKYAGSIVGDGWSLAWRTVDARYWGVPQRRRRIYLVGDFGGECAGEILFEREGLRGYFETSRTPWQGTAADAQGGTGADNRERNSSEVLPFDTTQVTSPQNGNNPKWGDTMYTLTAKDCHSVVYACSSKQQSLVTSENQANTLRANDYKEPQAVAYAMQAFGLYKESEVASSLKQRDYKDATDLVCGVDCRNLTEHPELYPTLQAKPNGGQSLNYSGALRIQCIVRRLTPTECCRLQGFPDWWEDGVEGSDSARCKMWGNGMALPNMLYVMQGIKATEDKRRGFDVWVRSSGHWG